VTARTPSSPVEPVEGRVTVEHGVSVRTLTWGTPSSEYPSLLLVHGLASNARLWDGVGAELVKRGWHAVAVDQRGHGRSDRPDHGYDFDTICRDLTKVMDHHQLERPLAVGQSWGGNVVVELAWAHAETILGAVAVDGGLIELGARFQQWDDCADALRPPTLVGTPLRRFEAAIRAAHSDWPEAGLQGVLACFDVRDDGTIAPYLTLERHLAILRALWGHRPSERFADIERPVMFVLADSGDAVWAGDKRAAAHHALVSLRRGRVTWMPGAHHDLHAQRPVEFTHDVISAWQEGFFT
jgi:pimeloyl-ACP methyl ester carboxylesterase